MATILMAYLLPENANAPPAVVTANGGIETLQRVPTKQHDTLPNTRAVRALNLAEV